MMQLLTIFILAQAACASTILQLNGTTYFSPDVPAGRIDVSYFSCPKTLHVQPATYLDKTPSSVDELETRISELLEGDDVLSRSFVSTLILPPGTTIPKTVKSHLRSTGTRVEVLTSKRDLPPGPYFLHPSGSVSMVYRLYVDYNMAFTQGVIQDGDGYIPSITAAEESIKAGISIPVPSRHYFKPSPERPLSGLRLGVKDIFDLKGIKTGAGSRSYFELYPPANKTAASLQTLIDLGAVVVGKLKTTQFANGEVPTANFVDQLAPFNPRADGYQRPGASSCGSGVAMASYEWLDLATGTDTSGSVRIPSNLNGLFGMRVTHGSLPLDGIVPYVSQYDTPGLIARDAKLLRMAYSAWFQTRANHTFPNRVVLPEEFWPSINDTSMPMFETFIDQLAMVLDAKVETISTNSSFIEHTGHKEGLLAFASKFAPALEASQWKNLGERFVSDYQDRFGRAPFINPVRRAGFAAATSVTQTAYDEANHLLRVYREWFRSQIVPSCDTIVVYPFGSGLETYRDESLNALEGDGSLYQPVLQASGAGVPDYTVQIGVRKFNSTVSQRDEEMPVNVGIISGAGCDQMLLELVVKLGEEMNSFKTTVKTGRTMW
ncbi:amidase signature enzyme [Fusarium albosuccineum]|uniref:Amidase signature enzyme n=1 Tax=Fusarium albosuccineum TaxID=1237068 RepID=A0A8H4PJ76_9HYPO|nr:amidase signature enzyme [Fusarium albosuccineum]